MRKLTKECVFTRNAHSAYTTTFNALNTSCSGSKKERSRPPSSYLPSGNGGMFVCVCMCVWVCMCPLLAPRSNERRITSPAKLYIYLVARFPPYSRFIHHFSLSFSLSLSLARTFAHLLTHSLALTLFLSLSLALYALVRTMHPRNHDNPDDN